MSQRQRVYVAGPLGFTTSGAHYYNEVVIPMLQRAGIDPLDPWDLPAELARVFALPVGHPDRVAQLPMTNNAVGQRNADMIRSSHAMLAVLDGSDVDSGTAAEIGFAAALGIRIIGLRTDLRTSGDNEAAIVNLQVEHFIVASGGAIAPTLDAAIASLQA